MLPASKTLGNIATMMGEGLGDTRRKIEPLLEVDINEMVAADRAIQRQCSAEDIDAAQSREIARLRKQVLRDLLEVVQLSRELPEQISAVCA
jgi:hypothetical protein